MQIKCVNDLKATQLNSRNKQTFDYTVYFVQSWADYAGPNVHNTERPEKRVTESGQTIQFRNIKTKVGKVDTMWL